jgi:hypothetical protein
MICLLCMHTTACGSSKPMCFCFLSCNLLFVFFCLFVFNLKGHMHAFFVTFFFFYLISMHTDRCSPDYKIARRVRSIAQGLVKERITLDKIAHAYTSSPARNRSPDRARHRHFSRCILFSLKFEGSCTCFFVMWCLMF